MSKRLNLVEKYKTLKTEEKELKSKLKNLSQKIIDSLRAQDLKKEEYKNGLKVTIIESNYSIIDKEMLVKLINDFVAPENSLTVEQYEKLVDEAKEFHPRADYIKVS